MNSLQGYLKQYTRVKKLACHSVSLNETGLHRRDRVLHARVPQNIEPQWREDIEILRFVTRRAPPATWSRYISERDSCLYRGEGGAWVGRRERKGWRVDGRRSRRRRGKGEKEEKWSEARKRGGGGRKAMTCKVRGTDEKGWKMRKRGGREGGIVQVSREGISWKWKREVDRRGKIMWVNEEKIKKRELSLMFENEGGGDEYKWAGD